MPDPREAPAPDRAAAATARVGRRHKYVVVFGTCCTADAIRPKDFADIRGSRLRLLWYQGRSSLLSMGTPALEAHEFTLRSEPRAGAQAEAEVDWNRTMAVDEATKRQHARLSEVIGMSDGLVFDVVSAFAFPYLVVAPGGRLFLESKDWQAHIDLLAPFERRRLWDFPTESSVAVLRQLLTTLYEEQPDLRVVFHLPRPCFNDGVAFEDPQLGPNIDFYFEYGERLYEETARAFPRVRVVDCGGERADPLHPNGQFPFHFAEGYMDALRKEIVRLLE